MSSYSSDLERFYNDITTPWKLWPGPVINQGIPSDRNINIALQR
jgi:hypothetical protein